MRTKITELSLFRLTFLLGAGHGHAAEDLAPNDRQRMLTALRTFADTVRKPVRDNYGERHTLRFVDGRQAKILKPIRWQAGGQTRELCNSASRQARMNSLKELTVRTHVERYRQSSQTIGILTQPFSTANEWPTRHSTDEDLA